MHDHQSTAEAANSLGHLALIWTCNLVAYLLGSMSPLQGIVLAATLVYTVLQTYLLIRDKLFGAHRHGGRRK